MSAEEKHLTIEQIDGLIGTQLSVSEGGAPLELLEAARRHVASCEGCQKLVSMHKESEGVLGQLGQKAPIGTTSECPPEQSLKELAAGIIPSEDAERVLKHAVQCDHCGSLLREAVETFAPITPIEETSLLRALRTAQPDWQKRLARDLASMGSLAAVRAMTVPTRGRPTWISFRPRARWYSAAAAVLLCALLGAWMIWRSGPSHADRLLAQAYAAQRRIELRIPEASYAPLSIQRGESRFDRPPVLFEAEEMIGRNLAKHPNDPKWLEAKGRAELLEGNYEGAIVTLERALESKPESAELLTELATGYFERAEAADRPIDYGSAVEFLSRALAKSPDDPVALFNRAIISEKLYLYTQALSDWEHYQQVDPNGPWADEARRRQEDLRTKLKNHAKAWAEPLLSASEVAKAAEQESELRERIDERVEEYLDVALSEWLPIAYPMDGKSDASDFQAALASLAEITRRLHGDWWMEDMLSTHSDPDFAHAVNELSAAFRANKAGDTVSAEQHAAEADRLFEKMRNPAGIARARVEYLFASHLEQDAGQCMRSATKARLSMEGHAYRWLAAQFRIEAGTCYGLAGNLGSAEQEYARAAQVAEQSRYKTIYLRTQDHLSGMESIAGAFPASWARTRRALENFWAGAYPPMRGYNLYYNLFESARMENKPHLEVAVWKDGLALSDTFDNNVLRAMAHVFMAEAATAIEVPEMAKRELAQASQFFSMAPQSAATSIARIEAETRLADIEVQQGRVGEAIARLHQWEPQVSGLSDRFLGTMFYAALGNAEGQAGEGEQAETALGLSIGLAELQLRTLRDDKSRMEWNAKSSAGYRALVQRRISQGRTQEALELWEWYRGAALRAKPLLGSEWAGKDNQQRNAGDASRHPPLAASPVLPKLQEITIERRGLTNETVVSFARLTGGLAVWVYDARGMFFHWTDISETDADRLARRFERLCSEPSSDVTDLQRTAREVYEWLIAPIEEKLETGRPLIIEADEALAGIPFDALVDSSGRYLSERVTILNSPGSYYRAASRRATKIATSSAALVVGVPNPRLEKNLGLVALPEARQEAEIVASSFSTRRLLVSEGATVEGVRKNLPGSEVFHFAGHAIATTGRSGLFLSDGLLGASLLEETELSRLQLAVLSGCDTLGEVGSADRESQSLVHAFLTQGVPHVVASRWSVDSVTTREFMESFYRSLLRGNDVSNAVREAQSALRSRPATAHPYYWSAFGVYGIS